MSTVRRFQHGSRIPGWDEAADLDKDPAGVPDPALVAVPAELRAEIEAAMALYPDRHSAALPALAAAQRVHGWCSPEAIEQVACVMRVTPAYLESVASFYDMLETEPGGRHSIYVCTNISCSLRGADALYESVLRATEGDEEMNVRAFECLGACDIAPMASVDGVYVGPLTPEDLPALLDDLRAGRDVLPAKQLSRRLVADPNANSSEFPEHPVHPLTIPPNDPEIPAERAALGVLADEDRGETTAPLEAEPE
ncbi:MAG: NAD(P)H-dependent oxidoreductase subunit E, partial [Solirubrobacteraceae bacterium]